MYVRQAGMYLQIQNGTTLKTFLGGEAAAGGKVKEVGTTHWNAPNTGATNETGFTAVGGGYRNFNGAFVSFGVSSPYWSSTENPINHSLGLGTGPALQ